MKPKSGSSDSGIVRLPHAHVSAEAYPLLAGAAVQANDGKGFVVERNPVSEQWRAWMAYFDRMEFQAFDRQGRPYTVNRGKKYETMQKITVPTAWPLEFDDSAPLPRPLTRDDMPIGPERKRELAALLRALGERIASGGRGRPPAPVAREAPPQRDGIPDYSAKPLGAATPSLAAYLAKANDNHERGGTRAEQS